MTDDLAYIRYSAKELLVAQNMKLEALQGDLNAIKLVMASLQVSAVTRAELTTTRRWAVGAAIAATGTFAALLRYLGI